MPAAAVGRDKSFVPTRDRHHDRGERGQAAGDGNRGDGGAVYDNVAAAAVTTADGRDRDNGSGEMTMAVTE